MATQKQNSVIPYKGDVRANITDLYASELAVAHASGLQGGYHPVNLLGDLFAKKSYPKIGGGLAYVSGHFTATTTGTSAAIAVSATDGGLKFTTGSTSTFYSGLQSTMAPLVVSTAGNIKRYKGSWLIKYQDVTKIGGWYGFGNSQADPSTTNYTDFVGFKKAPNSATLTTYVRGNSGTASTSTLSVTTANTTEFVVEVDFVIGASGIATGSWITGGIRTPMSAADITQLIAIVTSNPATFAMTTFNVGTTGAAYWAEISAMGSVDR